MKFFFPGMSSGSLIAGYTFDEFGSSASFRLLSYATFCAFLIQVSVNKLIKIKTIKGKTSEPKEPGSNGPTVTEEQNISHLNIP